MITPTRRPPLSGLFTLVLSLSLSAAPPLTRAQQSDHRDWNNKKCAVALTYDDGLNVHLDKVIPVLDAVGLKGTFYLTASREGVRRRIKDWRAAAANGHELGNHTLFHPCVAVTEGRDYSDWIIPEYDLNNYTLTRAVDEIRMANVFLEAIDGKGTRTIAYPCGDRVIKDASYVPLIRRDFAGGRGGPTYNDISTVDVLGIGAIGVDDKFTGGQLIDMVKVASNSNSLLVFCFHGVGGEHRTNIALSTHNELVRYLKDREQDVWVAPLVDIASFISRYQAHSRH